MVLFLYSRNESQEHNDKVRDLVASFRRRGVTCCFDQDILDGNPPGGWALWSEKNIKDSNYVVLIFSKKFATHFAGEIGQEGGKGIRWEGRLIRTGFYENGAPADKKFIPFGFGDFESTHELLPEFLKSVRLYTNTQKHIDSLVKLFSNNSHTELREYWQKLEDARYFSDDRITALSQLSKEVCLISVIDTFERDAIIKLCNYEADPGTHIFDLHEAVDLLKKVLETPSEGYDNLELNFWYLRDSVTLFIFGHSLPKSRLEMIQKIIQEIINLQEKSKDVADAIFSGRCSLLLGEALKEEAMITSMRERQDDLFKKSRDACYDAILHVKDSDGSKYALSIKGAAHRHLAVTYELEGNEGDTKEHRRALYREWLGHSKSATDLLKECGEKRVRTYALLNLGSAVTTLASLEQEFDRRTEQLNLGRQYINEAVSIFQEQQDFRGEGWAYVHLCDNIFKGLEFVPQSDRANVSLEAELFASRAVDTLRRTDDHLGLGLAYKQRGIALFQARYTTETTYIERIVLSKQFLEEAVNRLEQYGFHRWTGEAYLWLARCYSELWKTNAQTKYVFESVRILTKGLLHSSAGLRSSANIERINNYLLEELEKLLSG